jgi:hypothetical protein
MPRITLTMAEWQEVMRELTGAHTAPPPPGVVERIQALLAQAPSGWPDQVFELELDDSSAEAVRAVGPSSTGDDPGSRQRAASISEAMQIIWDHQQPDDGSDDDGQRVSV